MDFVDYFWIIKNITAERLRERTENISAWLKHREFSEDYDQMAWKNLLEAFRTARY